MEQNKPGVGQFEIEFDDYQKIQDKGCYIDEEDDENQNYDRKQQEIDEIL